MDKCVCGVSYNMDELSVVWYSGYHGNVTIQSSRQKVAFVVAILILCGFFMVVVGLIEENLHIRTGGLTLCGFGFITAVCFFCVPYFRGVSSQGAMQRNETSLTPSLPSVECIELILREQTIASAGNDDLQRSDLSTSRRDITFLLSRILGSPPSYEEVTMNDSNDTTMTVACAPPPYYTDLSQNDDAGEGVSVDGNVLPPSYESCVT